MLPEPAIALLTAAFPGELIQQLAPTQGGFSHHSTLLAIGPRRCVVKAATLATKRADLRHEATVLGALLGIGLAVPARIALLDEHEWTLELLSALPGEHGIAVYNRALAEQQAAVAALAALLAAAHAALIAPLAEATLAQRAADTLSQLPALALNSTLHATLAAALVHPIWQAGGPQGLVHGDAGLHNLLWHPPAPVLLDWEWAAWGTPLFDLAWLWWALRWRGAEALWSIFLAHYQAYNPTLLPAPADALRALAFGQIGGLLVRVAGQPAAYAEWLRRAEWSLALEFPAL